jgi:dihydroxy-acid dehydratase
MQPAGKYLGESYYRAGGVPAVMGELASENKLHTDAMTASGKTLGENLKGKRSLDLNVIASCKEPVRENAGFLVISGNLFDSALMKTSVISEDFQKRFFSTPGKEGIFEAKAIVFEGPEDYHDRINDPELEIDDKSVLFIRGVGCVGYPGSAEVVNMLPPDKLVKEGINHLPTVGDGRQSGTSESPSILNASPESVVGGGLAFLQTGDRVLLDLNKSEMNTLVPDEEWETRKKNWVAPEIISHTPWEEIYRSHVGQLAEGGCLEIATKYQKVRDTLSRDNH